MSKDVRIGPSDFSDGAKPLDTSDKTLVSSIHKMPLDVFLTSYLSPVKQNGAYLDMRRLPSVWSEAISHFPENHMFLYAYCQASSHGGIKELIDIRSRARKQCAKTGNEAGLLWLAARPKYVMKMAVDNNRSKFATWDCNVKDWMVNLAKSCCIPCRSILIIYSSKAMLISSVDLGELIPYLEREIASFDAWLLGEKQDISRFFKLL